MQSELCVSRQVSSKQREQIVSLERQCYSNCQYSRRECLELSGLPESMENSELEGTALQLFKKLHVKIDSSNIEDCHWLLSKGSKRVTVQFSKRKDANRIYLIYLQLVLCSSLVHINNSLCKYKKCFGENVKNSV